MSTSFFHEDPSSTQATARRGLIGPGALAEMSPAYFGMVMATGVVSLAAHLLAVEIVADALFGLNVVVYGVLWVLTVMRAIRYPQRFFGDMTHHLRAPGFFTTVAATSILGTQYLQLTDNQHMAIALWAAAIVLWVGLTYTIFTALIIKTNKPSLDHGINGSWLLSVVAAQSIAVLSAMLAARMAAPYKAEMNFFAFAMWLWGGMLYIWMISLIFYRDIFFRFSPRDLAPPYWISMGAMAISTLAGSLLILHSSEAPYLASLLPFLKGFTVFYWATGTWWIPMLLVLELWCYVVKRFPMRYDPLYWGAVFPLGMYAVGTYQMDAAMGFGFLMFLPAIFFHIALAAWVATLAGLVFELWRGRHTNRIDQQRNGGRQ